MRDPIIYDQFPNAAVRSYITFIMCKEKPLRLYSPALPFPKKLNHETLGRIKDHRKS